MQQPQCVSLFGWWWFQTLTPTPPQPSLQREAVVRVTHVGAFTRHVVLLRTPRGMCWHSP